MEILNKHELKLRRKEIVERIRKGAIFIHPTDTIYGIGCNALDENAVKKIRKLKDRTNTPFSVWVPSHDWIKKNSQPSSSLNKWLKEIPGPYTLIIKTKGKGSVSSQVNPGNGTLGVRIPNHWFHEVVAEANVPIVTTSANKAGEEFMTSLENLDSEIQRGTDFIVYEGEKKARPSKLVNLVNEEKVTER